MSLGAGPIGAGPIASDKVPSPKGLAFFPGIGTAPIGALPIAGSINVAISSTGTVFGASASLSGSATLVADTLPPFGTASARVTTFSFESLGAGGPPQARLSQVGVEVLRSLNNLYLIAAPLTGESSLTANLTIPILGVSASLTGESSLVVDASISSTATLTISAALTGEGYLVVDADFPPVSTQPAKVTSFSYEVLTGSNAPTDSRVTAYALETIHTGNPASPVKLSSVSYEILSSGDPSAVKSSTVAIETLRNVIRLFLELPATGQSTLAADAFILPKFIEAALTGDLSFLATLKLMPSAGIAMTGNGTMTATITIPRPIAASLSGTSNMVAMPGPLTFNINLAAQGESKMRCRVKRIYPDGIGDRSGYAHIPSIVKRDL
jgi:hypothetical protein